MLCYAMLCNAMLRYAMLCYANANADARANADDIAYADACPPVYAALWYIMLC